MRAFALSSIAVLVTGCMTDPPVAFSPIAVLDADTTGVVIHDDGTADAGMADQICVVDVAGAEVLGDLDLAKSQEVLHDAYGGRALASAGDSLYVVGRHGAQYTVEATRSVAVIEGVLSDDGVVILSAHDGQCAVGWGQDAISLYAVPGTDCNGNVGFAVDRTTGTAWIADGSSLTVLAKTGEFEQFEGVNADLVAWDAGTRQALLASRSSGWIQAVDTAGEVVWSRWLDGTVHDIDPATNTPVTAVMLAEDDGEGALVLLGVEDGETLAIHPLPEVAEISYSADGRTMGLTTDDAVRFYRVDPEVRVFGLPDVDKAPTSVSAGLGLGAGATAGALGTAVLVAVIVD